jgi:DNA-binding beta-propeller fold protein YncE
MGALPGRVYISDRSYKKILIVDYEKQEFRMLEDEGAGALIDPAGIWVENGELLYVADIARKQVVVFGKDEKFIRMYGKKGQFKAPVDVALYGNKIYVSDMNGNEVQVVDKDSGETIQHIGKVGLDEGEFRRPTYIWVDGQGRLYVNDSFNYRLQVFDVNGNYLKTVGYQGDTIGGFARPKGFAIDKENHLYAADAAFENVQIFDTETTDLLLFFGGFGTTNGFMYLPYGVGLDYHNMKYLDKYSSSDFKVNYLVYVGNFLGPSKLNVYGFGEWVGAPLPDLDQKDLMPGKGE